MDQSCMYQLTYGLFVLSAAENGKENGCIINTAMQVTTTPNRISITVNKQNYTHDMIVRTGLFNVSILDQTAPFALFQRFGFQSGRDADKLAGLAVAHSQNGLFYPTQNVSAVISGKVVQTVDLGTHTMFIADVTDGFKVSGETPLTYAYYHANVKPKPQPKTDDKKAWRCKICGYIYEGDPLPADFVCPICKHGAIDFEAI